MNIITRDFINKDIEFYDLIQHRHYDFDRLSTEINFYKNVLQQHFKNDLSKKSILIGMRPAIDQTACIFACFELGLSICIIDYSRPDSFRQYSFIDPKTELLLPIDLFIVFTREETDKFVYFNNVCSQTIVINEIEKRDYSENKNIFANSNSIIMRCTSSGTTDTPKIIEHTHEFLYRLSVRNATFYAGSAGLCYNLNHGSSFATFFLPILHCKFIKKIYNASQDFLNFENLKFLKDVDHIMIPYNRQILKFIKSKLRPTTTIYTLSTISETYLKCYQENRIKDIISFFGSNETSGPVMINRLSNKNFRSDFYYKIDDFYNIFLENNELNVVLPVYNNKVINTKDNFTSKDLLLYAFQGRSNLKKINGHPVLEEVYINIAQSEGLKKY